MLNVRTTLWSIFGILFIFSISFTAFAQQEQQAGVTLSQSQFIQLLEKIDESEDEMRKHVDKKFDELDEKFDELDKQVAILNTRVNILIAIIVGIFTLIVAPILVLMLRDRLNQRNSVETASEAAGESREELDADIGGSLIDNRSSETKIALG